MHTERCCDGSPVVDVYACWSAGACRELQSLVGYRGGQNRVSGMWFVCVCLCVCCLSNEDMSYPVR